MHTTSQPLHVPGGSPSHRTPLPPGACDNGGMSPTLYAAPYGATPVSATVHVPGSKSITNRALLLAALADGPSTITGALRSRDTDLMIEALRSLGTEIIDVIPDNARDSYITQVGKRPRATTLHVIPHPLTGGHVYCGLAGTLMRFLPGVAALATGDTYFDGDEQAKQRPLATVLDALRDLGATIAGNNLPFTVSGTGTVHGGHVTIDASASSQFVSGLMLCGARFTHGVCIHHAGDKGVPSQPHLVMTMDMLAKHGIHVDTTTPNTWLVPAGTLHAYDWMVEPDLSNATPFLAAAAVTGGSVTIADWPTDTTQPGNSIRDILTQMGCRVELSEAGLTVTGPRQLHGITLDMHSMGELAPTVAALAACADSPTELSGIAHLRGHETNRLNALVVEINRLGGNAEETPDGLIIRPAQLQGAEWRSYADHRMATAGAIVGLHVPGVTVHDIETTSKTLPGFAAAWSTLTSTDKPPLEQVHTSTSSAPQHTMEVWL